METTFSNYRDSVRGIVVSVIERVRDGEDPSDVLHEEVDGSYWVIYTHAAQAVLNHSRNDDAIFDQLGSDALAECSSMAEVYTRAAYYALYEDVIEELSDAGYDVSDPDTFKANDE